MKNIYTNTRLTTAYATFLQKFNWTLYSTLVYKNHITPKRNINIMNRLSETLKTNYHVNTIFWIGEYHSNMHSVHTHMLIETDQPDKVKKYIDSLWKRYYGFPATVLYDNDYNVLSADTTNSYSTGTGCPFYVTKFIDQPNVDYDFII